MIPSTPWEAPFQGIASWLGIDASDMLEVCPNLNSFNSSYLIDPDEIFNAAKVSSAPEVPEVPSFPSSEASSRFTCFVPLALLSLATLLL